MEVIGVFDERERVEEEDELDFRFWIDDFRLIDDLGVCNERK